MNSKFKHPIYKSLREGYTSRRWLGFSWAGLILPPENERYDPVNNKLSKACLESPEGRLEAPRNFLPLFHFSSRILVRATAVLFSYQRSSITGWGGAERQSIGLLVINNIERLLKTSLLG